MLKEIMNGYQPVIVGAFALDALIAVKNVFASFGAELSAQQNDALMALVALVIAFVVKEYTTSRKFLDQGGPS